MADKKMCVYEFCGKGFKPKNFWQKFCSVECRMKEHWQKKIKADWKRRQK